MPFESVAQQHFLEAHPEKVGGREKLKEWERSTDYSHLPAHVHHKDSSMHHDVSLYRAMHHLNHGGLHRALHIPEDKPIPQERLEAAKHSKNPHVAHMAHFASTMEGFDHK